MKILKENKILSSLKESENVKGLTIKEVAEKLFDGYIDIDVTDKDIDMMVAFVYDFNEPAKDSYDDFLNILGEKTKVLEMNDNVLLCDFTSVFKPYNDLLMNDFNMDESEFDDSEAYYEAVLNLEGLIPGFAPEYFYEDLYKILKGEGEKLEPINQFNHTSLEESDEVKIINPDDKDYSDGKLYKVGLYPGAGVELNTYYVYALYEEDALNQVVAYLDKQNSGLLITYDEMSNIVDNDYADEFKSFEQETGSDDWFEFVESDLSYTYVDATIEGAREPYFIDSENMVIEEVKDINESLTEGYMGVKGAEYINRGNWSDGAVRYRGFIYNAYEIQEALADYFEQDLKDNGKEVPSDNDYFTEFDKWIKENPDKAAGEVESLLYDYTPESIDSNIVSEIENEYSYKRLIKTMESWKTRTDIPEETIDEWIQMAKEHCEGNDFDEEENVSEIVNDIVYEMEDHDNLVKWFTITESANIKESSIPRNAKRIKIGNDEYYRDGSNWGKTSEKDLAIPRRYPSSFLRGQGDVEVLEVDKKYKPKRTREYRVLQGDYGSGWDDLVSYDTKDEQQMKDLRQNWKDYRDNEPNVPHRIITRREPIDESANGKITSEDLVRGVNLKCKVDGEEYTIYAGWDENFDFDEEVSSGNIPKGSNPEDWGGIIFEVNAVGEEYTDGGELVTNKDEFTATSLGSDLLDLIGFKGTDFELTSEVPKEEPEEKPKEKKPEGKTVTIEDLDSEGINYIFRGDVGNGDERLFINFALSSDGGIDYTIYREGGSEVDGGVMDVDTTKTWSSMDEVAKELVSFQGIKKAYSFIACDNGSADETLSQYGFINEAVREIKPRDRFNYGNNIKGDNYFLSYKTYKADPNSISFRKDGSVSVYVKYRTPDGKIREVMPTFEPGTTEEDLRKFADMLCKNGWDKTKKIINKKVNEAVTTSEPENATKPNKPNKVRNYLNYELEDDDTETGGVSFNGETVADFIGDADISEDDDLDKLNKALVSCGIRPIAEGYLTDYRGDDYWDLSDAYVNGSIDDRELAWELIKMFDSYEAAERAFKEITDGKKMPSFGEDFEDIKEITPDEANQLIGEWNNERNSVAKGRYLAQDGESKFIAIDNRTGDCWVEEFSNKGSAINWLEDKEEMNESLKESAAMDRVVLDAVKDYGITKVVSDEMKKEIKFTVPKATISSRDDYSKDDPKHYEGFDENDPRYDDPDYNDGYVCATIDFIERVEEALEDNGMRVNVFGEGESAVDGGTFTLTYEPRGMYEAVGTKKTGEEALQELVDRGVLQSFSLDRYDDGDIEYTIVYEIPMSVGSTERVITTENDSLEALIKAAKKSADDLGADIYSSLVDENDFFGYDSKEEMEERIDDEEAVLRNIATDLEAMLGSSNINEDISIKPGKMSANFTFDKNNVITNFDPGFTPKLTPEEKKKTLNTLNSIKNEKRGFSGDFEEVLWYTGEYFTEEENNKFKEYLNKVGDEISRANGDNYGVTAYDVLPSVIKWVKSIETINEAVDEKGNFTACYSINGGEYALSILQKANEGGEADLLVKAKDGKGNSALLSGYDQIEGFEFTKDDEPFYSGATISDEDIIALLKKFKPNYEVKSVERIPNKEVYKSMKESVKELDDFIDKHNLRGDLEKNDPANFMKSVDKVFSDNNLCYWCGRKIEGKPYKDKNGNPTCDKCYKELNESADIYDSVMIDANDLEPIPVCFNLYKPMKVEDILEYIRNNDYELDEIGQEVSEKELKGRTFKCNLELNESDTGYDYWGPKSMERFDGPAFIQYYGGPGDMEYLQKARNGRYVWINSANVGEPYVFDSYEDALKVQKELGGEIIDYNREYLGKDDTDEE